MNIEELKKKKNEESKQIWTGVSPKGMLCKTCKFAYPNTKYTKGYEKANCLIFESEDKPMEVLWNGAECDFYVEATK